MQAEGAPSSQIDLVAVVGEDLLLGQLLFEPHRHHQFNQFALPVFVWSEPKAARELHSQGGCALAFASVLEIGRSQL